MLTCARSLTLALPYIFGSIGENTLHVFGAVNLISIPIGEHSVMILVFMLDPANKKSVWALYPESSRRTLEEMDLLFAAKSPWVWAAESNFANLMIENPNLGVARQRDSIVGDAEKVWHAESEHEETVSSH